MKDSFIDLNKVGEGTFGSVYRAKDKETGEQVALKMIKLEREKEGFPITAIREIKILRALKQAGNIAENSIVDLREIVTSDNTKDVSEESADNDTTGAAASRGADTAETQTRGGVYLVFEYLEYDLKGLLDAGVTLTKKHVMCYMKQLLEGVHYMHRQKILHRDLKLSNLLIGSNGQLKIADWGLARSWNDNVKAYTNKVITLWYRPPELLLGDTQYTCAIDMWSVGCIFAELLNKKAPMTGNQEIQQLQHIWALCGTPTKESWPGVDRLKHWETFKPAQQQPSRIRSRFKSFDSFALDLVEKLLTLNPNKAKDSPGWMEKQKGPPEPPYRMTAEEALDHNYFWQPNEMPLSPHKLVGQVGRFKVGSAHEWEAREHKRNRGLAQAQ